MPIYKIQKLQSDYAIQYKFSSTQAGKSYFCNKILNMDYSDRDSFSRSSTYFEEMAILLSSYSKEKCYALKSFSHSINDHKKWGESKSEFSVRSNKEIIGESFLDSTYIKCGELFNKLKSHVNIKDISMPNICCEADNAAKSPTNFSCKDDNMGYRHMMNQIGCSEDEDVCELDNSNQTCSYNKDHELECSGSDYSIFESDLL